MIARTQIITIAVSLAAGIGFGSFIPIGWADGHTMRWVSGEFPEAFAASMEASSAAFLAKDMEATREYLTDDFATYVLHGEDAPKLLVKGRDETIAVMNSFFATDFGTRWEGADVERVGSIGTALVQVEHDRYKYDDGTRTISTLVIIQYKNGKRWKEWRLVPDPA